MYELRVFYPGEAVAHTTVRLSSGAEVLQRISTLLTEHDACEHIVVLFQGTRLFAVDCKGNRLP